MKVVTKQKPKRCQYCRAKIHSTSRGRPARYCRPSCRQRAFEKRKLLRAEGSPIRALNADLEYWEFQRRVVKVLESIGLVEGLVRAKAVKLRLIQGGRSESPSNP